MPDGYDPWDRRVPSQVMSEAIIASRRERAMPIDEVQVDQDVTAALEGFRSAGGQIFDGHQVAALRRSLEWVQTVIAATASTGADQRYFETLGLLGFIGEPSDQVEVPAGD